VKYHRIGVLTNWEPSANPGDACTSYLSHTEAYLDGLWDPGDQLTLPGVRDVPKRRQLSVSDMAFQYISRLEDVLSSRLSKGLPIQVNPDAPDAAIQLERAMRGEHAWVQLCLPWYIDISLIPNAELSYLYATYGSTPSRMCRMYPSRS
jgi:hypothetical protein